MENEEPMDATDATIATTTTSTVTATTTSPTTVKTETATSATSTITATTNATSTSSSTATTNSTTNTSTEDSIDNKKETVHHNHPPIIRVPVKHSNLGIRSHAMDMSTMVELTSFSSLGKIQPFLVTISATAAAVIDVHCHLSDKEVSGYLGGLWDINAHNLSILGAFPCRYNGKDKVAAAAVEAEISRTMEWKRFTLVGWYHSHPRSHASPSLRDVDAQLDYQIKMKGASDNSYTPCVALICSPYGSDSNCYESNFNIFWSMPPPENRPHEYPRPMLLSYSLTQEQFISQDAMDEIKKCVEHYKSEGGIDFTQKFNNNVTYLERLKNSLASKLPGRSNRTNSSYWDLIKEMLAPGFDDGSDSPFANLKFPVMSADSIMQAAGLPASTNVFLTPMNYKPENSIAAVQKAYAMQQEAENHVKESKHSPHMMNTSDGIPTFRAGELTVSLKSSKNDYDYGSTDFTKIDSMKGRSDFPLADLTHSMKFPDISKLASFSPSELAKITGISLSDFTKAASSSAYLRNMANLFGPLGKGMMDLPESNDRRSSEFPDMASPFKPPNSSSPAPKESSRLSSTGAEDYSSDKKKNVEAMDTSSSYTEDLSMSSSKPDYGAMLDMTTKKQNHSVDSGESMNLSKDRQ